MTMEIARFQRHPVSQFRGILSSHRAGMVTLRDR